jgi:hypothetical protein
LGLSHHNRRIHRRQHPATTRQSPVTAINSDHHFPNKGPVTLSRERP